ncbi:16S rRNA (cytosine(1402)-N(4))-methyltransferase, partial [Rhizobiaceae sp. 2RAB30]
LEDRIVKRFLADRSSSPAGSRYLPETHSVVPTFDKARKPVVPSDAEVAANPRARSARLRSAARSVAPARASDLSDFGLPNLPEIRMPWER